MGRPLGWAGTLSPRGPGMGFPLCLGSSLGLGCMTGQSRVNIVHVFCLGQGVRVTFGGRGHRPIPFLRPFDFAQGERNSPHRWMGSCLHRQDGGGRRGQGGSRTAPTGEGKEGEEGSERASPRFLAGPRNDRGERARLEVGVDATDWQCGAAPRSTLRRCSG